MYTREKKKWERTDALSQKVCKFVATKLKFSNLWTKVQKILGFLYSER